MNIENIKKPNITSERINQKVMPILRKMEKSGIKLDCDAVRKLDRKLSKRVSQIEEQIVKFSGHEFNISSPTQMAEVLFVEMKLPTEDLKKTKTGISTAANELNKIKDKHPIIVLILENRELSKLISTYLRPLPMIVDKSSRLHTTYGMETATGRLTSSEPNLQNIPIKGKFGGEIRKAFIASEGMKLIAADYSQIELRIIASISHDTAMIDAFKRGDDIHSKTAAEIFNTTLKKVTRDQRRIAKAVNFGIVYGQTPYGLSQALNIGIDKAAEYILHYFEIHQGIRRYINEMVEKAHKDGYVETIFGAKRFLPNIDSRIRYIAESEERMAINMPVQGTAAEILKLAMIALDKRLVSYNKKKPVPSKMLLTVHDELVVEAPSEDAQEVAKIVKESMEEVVTLEVPIIAELGVGDNWQEAKS